MYVFKSEALKDNVIGVKEINQWKELIQEYEEDISKIKTSKNEEQIDLNKIQEQTAKGLLSEVVNILTQAGLKEARTLSDDRPVHQKKQ